LLVAVAAFTACGGAAADQPVAFASLPQGTVNFFQSTAIAKVVQEKSALRARVAPMRGTALAIAAVGAGEAEFQLGSIVEAVEALRGEHTFAGRPQPKLRIAFNNRPLVLGILVRKDSGITRLQQLKGKRMPTGWKANPHSAVLLEAMLKTVGLGLADMDPVPVPELVRAADDFAEGKSDATYLAIDAPKIVELNAAVGGILILSLPNDAPALDAVRSVRPELFITTVKPSPRLVGVEGPTNLLAFDLVVTTSTRVPEEVVYNLVKAAYEGREQLIKAHPSFNEFYPDKMAKQFPSIEYHPGAVRFYKESGVWPTKH
jgi:TRAP transporter TAXI family solute receptor